jgi:hypothetical protein
MNYYQLQNGEVVGVDEGIPVPAGATQIAAEQFSQYMTTQVLTAAQAIDAATATLTAACRAAITSGFSSSALGASYTYPSDVTSQSNQSAVANSPTGGGLWCSASKTALSTHTQEQASQVCSDFVKWLNACQTKLATLLATVDDASSTVASIQALVWSNPPP